MNSLGTILHLSTCSLVTVFIIVVYSVLLLVVFLLSKKLLTYQDIFPFPTESYVQYHLTNNYDVALTKSLFQNNSLGYRVKGLPEKIV